MKKLILFLFVSLTTLTAIAQKAVTFKIEYKPNTVYSQTMTQTAKNEVSYKAPEEILSMLAAQGITNPTITENKTKTTMISTMGKLSGNQIPVSVKMSVISDDKGIVKNVIPDNTMMYGKIQDGKPVFDSINAPDMEAMGKEIFLKSIEANMTQVLVPERKVKVGETFTIEQPFTMPIGPATMTINNTATYKLLKIEGRKAHFEVSNVYVINSEVNGQLIKGTGFGTGNMMHDLDNNFISRQNMKMSMDMGFETNGVTLSIKFNNDLVTEYSITPVK